MQAGAFDRRVSILRGVLVDDGLQARVTEYVSIGVIWAARNDVSDKEALQAGIVMAAVMTKFRVRSSKFTRGILPSDRLRCEGREYDITGIREIGRRDVLEITATGRAG